MATQLEPEAINHLRQRINQLRGRDRARFAEALQRAETAGRGFTMSETFSRRNYELARGTLFLIEGGNFDVDLIRDLAGIASGRAFNNADHALAHMDTDEATAFANLCVMLNYDQIELSYDPHSNTFQTTQNPLKEDK